MAFLKGRIRFGDNAQICLGVVSTVLKGPMNFGRNVDIERGSLIETYGAAIAVVKNVCLASYSARSRKRRIV